MVPVVAHMYLGVTAAGVAAPVDLTALDWFTPLTVTQDTMGYQELPFNNTNKELHVQDALPLTLQDATLVICFSIVLLNHALTMLLCTLEEDWLLNAPTLDWIVVYLNHTLKGSKGVGVYVTEVVEIAHQVKP